ncbi:GAF domain-containing protein [Phycisphaera mikurensis]|uniref:GAF domain-containing protein n=1 Tax=Phycisphaera mikurensis (strain NBRC 102666 / KCTC 22515 / FYK2301M01) TaxID=1142394 RepID=I0IG07_PHYMF|nr:GAF domain-containing protein [Phycisphaera mikurensis]MBB6440419.1 hypothetical protein [Phycisphaera mikurensis]BAM04195.1 hypothetical protein PSMK_20360 [Phycisphaera mikurensis NBRC 102666]
MKIATQTNPMTAGVETWAPDEAAGRIRRTAGLYQGDGSEGLRLASAELSFSSGEGLPGAVMARGVPVLLDGLDEEAFPRAAEAREAGVTAALGLPVFDEDQLVSVVTFLFRGGPGFTGAVELWAGQKARFELGLAKAHYSGLERFGRLSKHVNFPMGAGLPGFVWENKCPKVVNNLQGSAGFLRSSGAETSGLAAAVGFPICFQNELRAVMLWLSTKESPLARLQEAWISGDGGALEFAGGSGLGREGLIDPNASAASVPAVATATATRRPVLFDDLASLGGHRAAAAAEAGLTMGVALPVLVLGKLRAVCLLAW